MPNSIKADSDGRQAAERPVPGEGWLLLGNSIYWGGEESSHATLRPPSCGFWASGVLCC